MLQNQAKRHPAAEIGDRRRNRGDCQPDHSGRSSVAGRSSQRSLASCMSHGHGHLLAEASIRTSRSSSANVQSSPALAAGVRWQPGRSAGPLSAQPEVHTRVGAPRSRASRRSEPRRRAVVRHQLDHRTASAAAPADRPVQQLVPDPLAAQVRGDAEPEMRARSTTVAEGRDEGELRLATTVAAASSPTSSRLRGSAASNANARSYGAMSAGFSRVALRKSSASMATMAGRSGAERRERIRPRAPRDRGRAPRRCPPRR